MTVVVTGASRGIGRATALALAQRGAAIALVGRQSPALDALCDAIRAKDVNVEAFPCDLRDASQIEGAASRLLDWCGPPAAVVHNAGVVRRAPIQGTSDASWSEQLAVNLTAPFLLTRALLPAMLRARRGRFVFVSSITATIGARNAAAYAATKWALVGFSKSLAEELTDTGLSSVAVLPGSVDTEMLEGSGFAPRMTADDVAHTLVHYTLDAPLAHNGAVVEMFGT